MGERGLGHLIIAWFAILMLFLFDNQFISKNIDILILALERVPPGYPRRIPLELFSEETLRRIDGLDKEEGNH